jgi:hypothetical protein
LQCLRLVPGFANIPPTDFSAAGVRGTRSEPLNRVESPVRLTNYYR